MRKGRKKGMAVTNNWHRHKNESPAFRINCLMSTLRWEGGWRSGNELPSWIDFNFVYCTVNSKYTQITQPNNSLCCFLFEHNCCYCVWIICNCYVALLPVEFTVSSWMLMDGGVSIAIFYQQLMREISFRQKLVYRNAVSCEKKTDKGEYKERQDNTFLASKGERTTSFASTNKQTSFKILGKPHRKDLLKYFEWKDFVLDADKIHLITN